MKELLTLLRTSRLLQIVVAILGVAVAVSFLHIFLPSRLLPATSNVVMAVAIGLLALRNIQLEWKVATAEKSVKVRRAEIETRFDSLAKSLRGELANLSDAAAKHTVQGEISGHAKVAKASTEPSNKLVIGRTAAGVPESTQRQSVLYELMGQGQKEDIRPKISGVFSPSLRNILVGLYEVTDLSPSFASEQISRVTSGMVVIDQKAFESGPWCGADSATGTLLFSELTNTMDAAKSAGTPVWFVATDSVPNPYTNEYRKRSTGVFGFDSIDTTWTEGLPLRFVDAVDEYVAGEKK